MYEDMSEAGKIFLVTKAKAVARYLKYCSTSRLVKEIQSCTY
jgi:hypothetical protein